MAFYRIGIIIPTQVMQYIEKWSITIASYMLRIASIGVDQYATAWTEHTQTEHECVWRVHYL